MNNFKKTFLLLFTLQLLVFSSVSASGISNRNKKKHFFNDNIEYEINAHFSIGGSAPLGLPTEIRKIESYNPNLQLGIGAHATKWLCDDSDWGVRLGISTHTKGMETKARVKDYRTEVIIDKLYMKGVFTGLVKTRVKNTYLTIPVSMVYKLSDRWRLYGGPHVSFTLNPGFDGFVSDGVFRQGDSTGDRFVFEDDSQAAYDFSDSVKRIQWGVQAGGEWSLRKNLVLFSHLDYDFNDLFKKDFNSLTFSLHNLYLNLGFGYRF